MLAGFRWIIEGSLAGSALPGLLNELDVDLEFIRAKGIRRIVSLTSRPLSERAAGAGFELVHFPIADMGIPTPRSCADLCGQLLDGLEERPVLLHCRGGLGRTGTVAACLLVGLGRDPHQALLEVRKVNPNYVQTSAQAKFIEHYAAWVSAL